MYDLIIIGGGPAGITAAIYAARKYLKTLLLTKDFQGQIFFSAKIENYPGLGEISGTELSQKLKNHLLKFATKEKNPKSGKVKIKENVIVQEIKQKNNFFEVKTKNNNIFASRAVIVATGASPRKLKVKGADNFEGKGVAFCETCDGLFFKGKNVAVIGGGNAGLEAAEELAEYVKKVYLFENQAELPGDSVFIERLKKKVNVSIITNVEIKEIKGKALVEKIRYFDKKDNNEKEKEISGIFVKIGQIPNSNFTEKFLKLNKKGEIIVDPKTLQTSKKGVFAAGDVSDVLQKQYIIAAGEGAKATMAVYDFLKNKK